MMGEEQTHTPTSPKETCLINQIEGKIAIKSLKYSWGKIYLIYVTHVFKTSGKLSCCVLNRLKIRPQFSTNSKIQMTSVILGIRKYLDL